MPYLQVSLLQVNTGGLLHSVYSPDRSVYGVKFSFVWCNLIIGLSTVCSAGGRHCPEGFQHFRHPPFAVKSVGEMYYSAAYSELHALLLLYSFLFLVGLSLSWKTLSETMHSHTLKQQELFWNLAVYLPRDICACYLPCSLVQAGTKLYLQREQVEKHECLSSST